MGGPEIITGENGSKPPALFNRQLDDPEHSRKANLVQFVLFMKAEGCAGSFRVSYWENLQMPASEEV